MVGQIDETPPDSHSSLAPPSVPNSLIQGLITDTVTLKMFSLKAPYPMETFSRFVQGTEHDSCSPLDSRTRRFLEFRTLLC